MFFIFIPQINSYIWYTAPQTPSSRIKIWQTTMKSSGWALFTSLLIFSMIVSESNNLREVIEHTLGFMLTIFIIGLFMKIFFKTFPFFKERPIKKGIDPMLSKEE